jgi:hypothetical protein
VSIYREHDDTQIPELVDSICNEFFGVGRKFNAGMTIFFISLSGVFYRFFIDESILFWDVGNQDPEDDLSEGEKYIDIASKYNLKNLKITNIQIKDGILYIVFNDVEKLKFINNDDLTFIEMQHISNK